MSKHAKPAPAPAPALLERSMAAVSSGLQDAIEQQTNVLTSTMREVLEQQKRIFDRLGELMSSIDDLNSAENQLAQDTMQQSADISALNDAQSKAIVAVQQQIAALKQQQPALDLTSLNASILTLEANHGKLIDLANSITASAATAPDPAAGPTSAPAQSPADPNSTGTTVNLSQTDPTSQTPGNTTLSPANPSVNMPTNPANPSNS